MKKVIALILAVIMIAAVSSCRKNDTAEQTTGAAENTTAENTTAEITGAETAGAELNDEMKQFRNDNFAAGKLSDELLDSVNPGVLALLSECMYYEAKLQEGIAAGEKWVYSNSTTYVPLISYFDKMVNADKQGANCAMPQAWFFTEMGVVPQGKHLYGNTSGGLNGWTTIGKYVGAVSTVYEWGGTKQFKDIYAQGDVKPGDIFYCKGHTFIYLGDEKFMAAGHDGKWHTDASAYTEDSRKAVFDSWICDMASNTDYTYAVYYQLRLRDDYMPRYYRNAAGELVSNPAYNDSLNIEYKTGDKEQTSFVDKTDRVKVYDTSGKTNVLLGLTTTAGEGINLSKFNYPTNITDGQLYYDNTTATFTDIIMNGGNSYATNPTYWFDANGNKSTVKDETHKYLCAFRYTLAESCVMDSFSVYTQAVGASSNLPFGDIDGFDILISQDGTNWTVAYSIENAQCEYKWTDTGDERNKASTGYYMCHYIRADFTRAVEGKYVMFALTQARTCTPPTAGKVQYSYAGGSAQYFRIAELQVYKKQ